MTEIFIDKIGSVVVGLSVDVIEWRKDFVSSFMDDHPDEAEFWKNELRDPLAALFWYHRDTSARELIGTAA